MTIKISVTQRRARLIARHHLAVRAGSVADATTAMIVLHASDPLTVYLSAWARTGCAAGDVDEALYAERAVVRMLGMRRTLFVVPTELVSVIQAACTDDVARRLRRQLEKDLDSGGIGSGDAAGWLWDVGESTLRLLVDRGGGASGAQLSADEPRLRTELTYSPDKSYGGTAYVTSRILGLLAAEGHLVRGHRRGGRSSGQFEWHPAVTWLAGSGAGGAEGTSGASDVGGASAGVARAELARRWLLTFGPAPVSDLQWWAGWTGGQTKAALAALPVVEVDLSGRPGVLLAGDESFADEGAPVAALLPALDPTPMGWQARDWFLGQHRGPLFDRTGNIGPTVWWAGRIVGGWAQRASGEVVWRLLEDAGADAAAAVAAAAVGLESWLDQARVTPRFRTPLERELAG